MDKTKRFFKVVSVDIGEKGGRKLVSAVAINPHVQQQYFVGKWVKAKVGGFLVFEDYKTAYNFVLREFHEKSHFIIYECAVKGHREINAFACTIFETSIDADNTFQELSLAWEGKFDRSCTHYFPVGTKAYEEIKLTRKIVEKKGCKPFSVG